MHEELKTEAQSLKVSNTSRSRGVQLEKAKEAPQKSEEKWRFLQKNTSDVFLNLDRDGTILFINHTVPGYTVEDAIGKTVYDFIPPEQHEKTRKAIEEVFKTGEVVSFETSVLGPDGSPLWYSTRLGPVKDRNKVVSVAQTSTDITERKKTEEALRESEQIYKGVVDNIGIGVSVISPNMEILFLNRQLSERCPDIDVSKKPICYKSFNKPPREDVCPYCPTYKTLKDGQVHESIIETRAGDKIINDRIISSPIKDRNGKVIAAIEVVEDITERKRADEALKESESEYRTLVENLPQKIFLKDKNSVYVSCNESLAKDFKIKAEEIAGKTDYDLVPKELAEKYRADDKRIIESGQTKAIEDKYIQQGEERIIHTVKTPVKDEQGNVIAVLGIFWDITERKKTQEVLKESEEKYRALVESAAESIATVNEDGVFLFMSETGAKRLGGKPSDYVGKTMWDLFPKKTADQQAASVRKVINTGEGMNLVVLTELRGELRWENTTVEPLRDGNGKVTAAMIVARDIHELRQAEEQVRKLSSAVEQSIDGIAIGDLEPKLLYVNDAFARMHGYSPEEMIGMAVTKLHSKKQMSEYKKEIKQIKTQGSWHGEIGHIRKDGTAFCTYISATLLKNNEGKPTGMLAVTRDITEDKRRAEELSTYRENMVQAEELAAVGTLSATLAHELTQPLTVIRLSIENSLAELETMSCPGTVVEDLKEGLSELSSMTSLVDRFRKFAKMSTEKTVSEVDLKAVADRIVKSLDESAWRAKVTLQLEGMDKLPLIYSQERELEQIFFSLVENAIQAADGKKKRQVIIRGAVRDEHIELQFSDNCGGIAPENLDKIFDPFFTTKHADERTGLGLCVVEHIVSQGVGKVRVESKLGKGSTFFVTLPINRGRR